MHLFLWFASCIEPLICQVCQVLYLPFFLFPASFVFPAPLPPPSSFPFLLPFLPSLPFSFFPSPLSFPFSSSPLPPFLLCPLSLPCFSSFLPFLSLLSPFGFCGSFSCSRSFGSIKLARSHSSSFLCCYGSISFSSQTCCPIGWKQNLGQLPRVGWSKYFRQHSKRSRTSTRSDSSTSVESESSWISTFSRNTFDSGFSTDSSRTSWQFSTFLGYVTTIWADCPNPKLGPKLWLSCCSTTPSTGHWTRRFGTILPTYSTYMDFLPISGTSSTSTLWAWHSILSETYSGFSTKSIYVRNTFHSWQDHIGQNSKHTYGPILET